MAHLKTTRASAKRAVTKEINQIRQCIAEDNIESLSNSVIKLKDLFRAFTWSHTEYHDSLVSDEDIDESDAYFRNNRITFQFCKRLKVLRKTFISNLSLIQHIWIPRVTIHMKSC